MNIYGCLGAAFLTWSFAATTWAISLPDAVLRDWQLILAAGAFLWGSAAAVGAYRALAWGIGLGMIPNAILAALQALGIAPWLVGDVAFFPATLITSLTHAPSGLFMNGNYFAEAAAISLAFIIAAPVSALPKAGGATLCGLCVLAGGSRGADIAMAAMLAIAILRDGRLMLARWIAGLGMIGAVIYVYFHLADPYALAPRYAMWMNTAASWTWMGHGTGSYMVGYATIRDAYMPSPASVFGFVIRPQSAHNDLLTILFEDGAIGVMLFVAFCGAMIWRAWRSPEIYPIAAALVLGLTNFPLFNPVPLFLFSAACGWASSGHCFSRSDSGMRWRARPENYSLISGMLRPTPEIIQRPLFHI